jgi:broad specificity phosphatase PhoE
VTTTIILVRHCVHDLLDRVLVGRAPNVPLSAAGIAQAHCLAAALVRRGVTGVKSSPQMRARQTADPVAALIGKPAEIMPEFDEADFGAWSGCAFDSLQNDCQWQRWNSDREASRPPGGEAMRELQSRVLAGLLRLVTAHPGACIAVVTHAEPVRAAMMHYLGIPLGEFTRVEIDPGSCTTIKFDGERGATVSGYARAEAMMAAPELARTSARVRETAAG